MPTLELTHGHTLHYTEHGNPGGTPAVYLHGGPGSGSKPDQADYFNLKTQHVILYDQRGCGQSTPTGSLKHNTTQLLVEDLERLRAHLNFDKWQLVGFSWGSTLALAYAQKYPKRVSGMVLGAVFMGSQPELDWFIHPNGAPLFYPREFAAARALLPKTPWQKLPATILKALLGPNKTKAKKVAEAWTLYDALTMELDPNGQELREWIKSVQPQRMAVMWHYFTNHCFLKPQQLLKGAAKLKGIPLHIVQAHYDLCTPPAAAIALHQALPKSQLTLYTLSGHRPTPELRKIRSEAITTQTTQIAKRLAKAK
jgi:proline iminopeptidase